MKLNIIIIIIVFLAFSGINFVFAQNTGSVALVFLRPDKEIYFPGDSVFIHGQDDMNVTSITIGLEKNHKLMTISKESQVLQNGTFYANFTLPKDPDAQYWSLVSGPLHQDLYFKPVYLSPLGQFREGIASKDVQCEQGLQLVIKAKDGSPACVKQDTVQKLIERGWVKLRFETGIVINSYTPISNETEDQTVKIVEIKMVPPYTPGGPVIQLTIQNVGTTPITNLNAILETNHNYTFNFKSITSSTPLISGNSRSDTTMLVGGGFQTESTYSLIISGMKDNMPFEYLEKVRIQG